MDPILPPAQPPLTAQIKTSGLAITSMVLGILSIIIFCFGPVFGIPSLIFGFIALSTIKKSNGQVTGKGMALAGIILSLVSLLIFALMILYNTQMAHPEPATGLQTAEKRLARDTNSIAHGNNTDAIALAEFVSTTIQKLDQQMIEQKGREHVSLQDVTFLTYCELRKEKCGFIIHVPGYLNEKQEAKEAIAELAWSVCNSATAQHPELLPAGSDLAVGIKGTTQYGSVMIGTNDPEAHAPASLILQTGTNQAPLDFFFDPEEEEEEIAE